jgi:hypothetical protein
MLFTISFCWFIIGRYKFFLTILLSKKFSFNLGFELWEILTAFTLALTLASFLLWYSGLQPKHIQDQFIWQEQSKSTLYNSGLEMDKVNLSGLKALPKAPTDYCQTTESDFQTNKTTYNQNKEVLQIQQKNIQSIKEGAKTNTSYTGSQKSFGSLLKSYENYLDKTKTGLEKKLFISEQVANIRKAKGVFCTKDKKIETLPLTTFQELSLERGASSDKNLQALADNSSDILNAVKGLESKTLTEIEPEKQELLKTKYQTFWLIEDIDQVNLELPTNSRADILVAFKEFENWQADFVKKEKDLDKKVVFIVRDAG